MNAWVPMGKITDGVFGYAAKDRRVLVLKAYFDDSGTHDNSDVTAMGGLIAHEDDWARLEVEWGAALDEFGLDKMRMSSLRYPKGKFKDRDELERERIITRFRKIICGLNARMIAHTVSRRVWDAVAADTRLGQVFSEPIDLCFNACMRSAMEAKRGSVAEPEPVVVTFDCREQNLGFWQRLASGYEALWPSTVAGFAFGNMAKVRPLQAADMIAYEAFVFQCDREHSGAEPKPRPNFAALLDEVNFAGQFFTEENLRAYAAHFD